MPSPDNKKKEREKEQGNMAQHEADAAASALPTQPPSSSSKGARAAGLEMATENDTKENKTKFEFKMIIQTEQIQCYAQLEVQNTTNHTTAWQCQFNFIGKPLWHQVSGAHAIPENTGKPSNVNALFLLDYPLCDTTTNCDTMMFRLKGIVQDIDFHTQNSVYRLDCRSPAITGQ